MELLTYLLCVLETCSRATMPCVLICSRANLPCVLIAYLPISLMSLRACLLTWLHVRVSCMLTCSCANLPFVHAYLSTSLACLRANVPCVLTCQLALCACVLTCQSVLRAPKLTCQFASSAYLLHLLTYLAFLGNHVSLCHESFASHGLRDHLITC